MGDEFRVVTIQLTLKSKGRAHQAPSFAIASQLA
jgi:hypothetical protein